MRPRKVNSLSLGQFPAAGSSALSKFLLFAVLGAVCVVVPSVLNPALLQSSVKTSAVASLAQFELHDEFHAGQFKLSNRSGDALPSADANEQVARILSLGGSLSVLSHLGKTREYLAQLEAQHHFHHSLSLMYHSIRFMKTLKLFKGGDAANIDRHVQHVLSMQEDGGQSGFRATQNGPVSVRGTYYALATLRELERLDAFKSKHADRFAAALAFVAAMQQETGGFRDSSQEEQATVAATLAAVKLNRTVLAATDAIESADRIASFLSSCQLQDGGFQNSPVASVAEYREGFGSTVATADALYIAACLAADGGHTSSPLSRWIDVESATAYLQYCASAPAGVAASSKSLKHGDLHATAAFLELANDFAQYDLSSSRLISVTIVAVGFLFFVIAGFYFYSPQLADQTPSAMRQQLIAVPLFLTVGGASSLCEELAPVTLLTYLTFIVYLVIHYYEYQKADVSDHMVLMSAVHSALYLGLMFLLLWLAPMTFAQITGFYLVALWNVPVSLLVGYFGAYYWSGARSTPKFYAIHVQAAFLAWCLNVVVQYLLLYGRGEMQLVVRMSLVYGHFFSVFVVLPYLSLLVTYGMQHLGAALLVAHSKKQS